MGSEQETQERQARRNFGTDWVTLTLFAGCFAVWALALMLPLWIGLPLMVAALTLHSSLSHEILHGHPFRSQRLCDLLALVQPGLLIPYLRFKALHLAHHNDATLTDPYDDPETNYLDPAVWQNLPRWRQALYLFNNTLLGRMAVGPAIGMVSFIFDDLRLIRSGDRAVAMHWLAHLPGGALVIWVVSVSAMPLWAYLLACYGALSVLKIRTFLEHQAHERASGRSVIIEDRGPLAFLFLNNNLHVVHHMHPKVAWHQLPALYRARKDHYQRRNHGYVYPSYGAIFRDFLLHRKDPVAHPLFPKARD